MIRIWLQLTTNLGEGSRPNGTNTTTNAAEEPAWRKGDDSRNQRKRGARARILSERAGRANGRTPLAEADETVARDPASTQFGKTL
jgi:hypothetical protein